MTTHTPLFLFLRKVYQKTMNAISLLLPQDFTLTFCGAKMRLNHQSAQYTTFFCTFFAFPFLCFNYSSYLCPIFTANVDAEEINGQCMKRFFKSQNWHLRPAALIRIAIIFPSLSLLRGFGKGHHLMPLFLTHKFHTCFFANYWTY